MMMWKKIKYCWLEEGKDTDLFSVVQDGYPMRPKGLNYINTPEAFNTVFNIFKSFMKEKMKRRVSLVVCFLL